MAARKKVRRKRGAGKTARRKATARKKTARRRKPATRKKAALRRKPATRKKVALRRKPATRKRSAVRRSRRRAPWWSKLSLEELLDVRIRDLELRIEGSALEGRIEQLRREIERAGLVFQPYVWLSTDWFTPNHITGFAIPFYLAHPRLARLEGHQMLEVEGGAHDWCMRLLRHETAHALDNAYLLHRRKRWKDAFGAPGAPYRPSYVPRPNNRRYVVNLTNWYAQSHPVEDFAETFAVWLSPRSAWRMRYRGWPALRKLEYVDDLMAEIGSRRPKQRSREHVDSVRTLGMTLREYYRRRQAHYKQDDLRVYDRDLKRLFSDDPDRWRRRLASSFLRDRRRALRRQVAAWTGQPAFVVDKAIADMAQRCRELELRLAYSERETGIGAAVLLTVHTVRLIRMRHKEFMR